MKSVNNKIRINLDNIGNPFYNTSAFWIVKAASPFKRHAYPVYEINYVLTGNLSWRLDNGSMMTVKGGEISILQPNTFHECINDFASPASYLVLCAKPAPTFPCHPFISRKEMNRCLDILKKAGNCVVRGSCELSNACTALRNAVSSPHGTLLEKMRLRNLLDTITIQIFSCLAKPSISQHSMMIDKAKKFITFHLTERISVNDLADIAGLGIARFHTLFLKETGETPAEYHQRLRLEKAASKLRDTHESVTNIALEYGFCSNQHFTVRFKKHYGVTPSEYRKSRHH